MIRHAVIVAPAVSSGLVSASRGDGSQNRIIWLIFSSSTGTATHCLAVGFRNEERYGARSWFQHIENSGRQIAFTQYPTRKGHLRPHAIAFRKCAIGRADGLGQRISGLLPANYVCDSETVKPKTCNFSGVTEDQSQLLGYVTTTRKKAMMYCFRG